MNKTVVYTAIFGNYDDLIPQPHIPNVDFVCFTDSPIVSNQWQIRQVKSPFPDDPIRSNRYYKINAHLVLPEYTQSIYIDGNVLIIRQLDNLIQTVFSQATFAAFAHTPPISNPENCIYKEFERIVEIGHSSGVWFDNQEIMRKQIEFLESEHYPISNGLIAGSILMRKHNDPVVRETMEIWWDLVKNRSRRDQLSFNYAAWKTGLNVLYLPGEVRYENPWFWRLGGHNQALWFRYLKYQLRLKLGKINHPDEQKYLDQIKLEEFVN